ncbi:MAG: hypothetical protein WCT46_00555 [Candidatus Gracilibacteria bacterium]|jgi:hypothetical protein
MTNLKNLLSDLERQGKLKKQNTRVDFLNALLYSAHRNLKAASANINSFEEVAFKAAYDGLLQISRVVLLLNGYRPDDGEQHKTTFIVAGAILGDRFVTLINRINIYRVKRNNCVYDPKGLITKTETENIIKTSKEYWGLVRIYLKNKDPQLELFDF